MSRQAIEHLRDYIEHSLTPSEISWLANELIVLSRKHEAHKPYTVEELCVRVAESEQEIAEGRWKTAEESLTELENLFQDEHQLA